MVIIAVRIEGSAFSAPWAISADDKTHVFQENRIMANPILGIELAPNYTIHCCSTD